MFQRNGKRCADYMIESLSLLGIQEVSAESFELLRRSSVSFVDLSPGILGIDLLTDRLDLKVLKNIDKCLKSSNIAMNAVQGAFFGLHPDDFQLVNRAELRVHSLFDAMEALACENLFIGAPSLRTSPNWRTLLETTFRIAESRNTRVILENICPSPCSENLLDHYCGLDQIDTESVCVDTSNFANCNQISQDFEELFSKVKFVHLSGRNHTLPSRTDFDFQQKQTAAREQQKNITYEFLGYEMTDLANFFAEDRLPKF